MKKKNIISISAGTVLLLGTFLPVVKAETEQNLQDETEQMIEVLDEIETNNEEELEVSSSEDEGTEIDEDLPKGEEEDNSEKNEIHSEVIESNKENKTTEETEKDEPEVIKSNNEDEMPVSNEESETDVELINKLLATKELAEFDLIIEKYSEDELERFVLSLSDINYKKIEKHFEYLLDKEHADIENLQQTD